MHTGFAAAAIILGFSTAGYCQSTTLLRGNVTDPQGASISEAVVKLSNAQTGLSRESLTSATGEYQFLQLTPGTYTITVEKAGFAAITRTDVQSAGEHAHHARSSHGTRQDRRDRQRHRGSFHHQHRGRLGRQCVFGAAGARASARNQERRRTAQPAARRHHQRRSAGRAPRSEQHHAGRRGRERQPERRPGGAEHDHRHHLSGRQRERANVNSGFNSVLPVPLDSVQEFRVTVGGQGADQGRSSGGQVVLVTKSGTNQLHGSLYEYNRNTATSANTWFNNQSGVPVQQLVRNQFGASIGGPIKKDRLFYFVNWEQRIDASSVAQVRAVPSETLKQGILQVQLTDGSVQTIAPSQLPQIDPLGIGLNTAYQKILNQYPVGNDPGLRPGWRLEFQRLPLQRAGSSERHGLGRQARLQAGRRRQTHAEPARHAAATTRSIRSWRNFPARRPHPSSATTTKAFRRTTPPILSPTLINSFTYGLTRLG